MNSVAVLGRSVVAALRPAGAPWAVGPALSAIAAAALIAGTGGLTGDVQVVAVAYLGAVNAVAWGVR